MDLSGSYQFEINNLFQRPIEDYDVTPGILYHNTEPLPGPSSNHIPTSLLYGVSSKHSYYNVSRDLPDHSSTAATRSLRVRGADVGDIPAEYHVKGLKYDELPVIGKLKRVYRYVTLTDGDFMLALSHGTCEITLS